MEENVENLSEIFGRLSIAEDEERYEILKYIKSFVSNINNFNSHGTNIQTSLCDVNLVGVFDCLNTTADEEIQLTTQTLTLLLNYLRPKNIIEKYSQAINRGLVHPHPAVKICVLKTLQRVSSQSKDENLLPIEMLMNSISLLSEELSIAKEVSELLFIVGEDNPSIIFSPPIFPVLKEIIMNGDIVKYRVYELVVKLCVLSSHHLNKAVEIGILNDLSGELSNNTNNKDVLGKLNALEIMNQLAKTEHGYRYLVQSSDTVNKLEENFDNIDDPMHELFLPGLMTFFGHLASVHPQEVLDNFPKFASLVESSILNNEDSNLQIIAAETIGFIAKTKNGKEILEKQNENPQASSFVDIDAFFRFLSSKISTGTSELKIRSLTIFADLLTVPDEAPESWFNKLGKANDKKSTIKILNDFITQPFPEYFEPAYKCLELIALQNWGPGVIANGPGLIEHLLNRETAKDKSSKEFKFNILENIVKSCGNDETISQIFGGGIMMRIREYVKQGPFHVDIMAPQVAYREES